MLTNNTKGCNYNGKKIITGLFVALLCLFIVFPNRMFADPSYRYNFPGNDTIREMSVTKDGTAYGVFLSGDRGKLVSFSKDGKVNWSIYGPHHEEMYMTTDGKGRVYTAIGAKVTAYDTLGKVRWTKNSVRASTLLQLRRFSLHICNLAFKPSHWKVSPYTM